MKFCELRIGLVPLYGDNTTFRLHIVKQKVNLKKKNFFYKNRARTTTTFGTSTLTKTKLVPILSLQILLLRPTDLLR